MSKEAMKLALEAAYLAGFNASGEGYNGEYGIDCPEENAIWKKDRDNALLEALAEQPAQKRPQNCGTGYCSCIECVMEPAQQEPVAFLVDDDLYYPEEIDWESLQEQGHTVVPLYTSPPAQRTWVGLTDEEVLELFHKFTSATGKSWLDLYRTTEAKLKEKNT